MLIADGSPPWLTSRVGRFAGRCRFGRKVPDRLWYITSITTLSDSADRTPASERFYAGVAGYGPIIAAMGPGQVDQPSTRRRSNWWASANNMATVGKDRVALIS